ncbi:hypothetical protein [Polaribacter porphyrae]|uniref:Uncharacterized protein n=1 Tax=Polaribacter porphyrae TaxID=1137780 RepID=A0A2S7WNZ9_9FLAO|nr:hypothetical protein [Polaribacter porphyrae]PQJ79314.1 hypothetical protein BTO18_09080 [Polaribacter porphyrae]
MDNKDLDKVLGDVRIAYRLLYEYQKRVLDLVSYLGNNLGFSYEQGCPRFSSTVPRKGKRVLSRWSWDWLNMYFYEFHFGTQEKNNDKITMSVIIQSDTGYYDGKTSNSQEDRLNLDNFKPVELSNSRIIFIFELNGNWTIDDSFLKKDISNNVREWISESKEFYGVAYNLSEFYNNVAIDEKVEELNILIKKKLNITLIEREL